MHPDWRAAPALYSWRKPTCSSGDPAQPRRNKFLKKRFTLITSHLVHHNALYSHSWSLLLSSTLPSRMIFLKYGLSLPLKLLHGSPGILLRGLQLLTLMLRVSSSTSPRLPLLSDRWTPLATTQPNIRRRQWPLTPVLLPGKSHGQRSLVGCSPCGRKESDTTERLHFHFSLSCIGERSGNPLQCSCLENPRDRGAWWAAVYGVTQNWTRLK